MESGSLLGGLFRAKSALHSQLRSWGGLKNLTQAQGMWGTEFATIAEGGRSLVSVTTDLATATRFANGGTVYKALIPRSKLIAQTLGTSTESEFFVRFAARGFKAIP